MLTKKLKDYLIEKGLAQSTWTDESLYANAAADALESGELSEAKFNELTSDKKTPEDIFGKVRLKKPSERYSHGKSVAKHVRTGLPVHDEKGKPVETVSEMEHAKIGAWLKFRAGKDGQSVVLDEHERELVGEIFEHEGFCGKIGSQYETAIPGSRVKALISDSTSGGAELNPEFFDSAVIQFPLLHSELLPRVDLRDVPRGSSVEGASVGNPTVTWNSHDGTSLSPFDTQSLVAEINTTIHPVTCAVEIGRDFLSDAAVDVGRVLVENIGQRMLAELDKVIAVGNGTTQPQGLFNASSILDIGNPAGGSGAAPTVGDYEELLFTVGKQYRNAAMRPAFIGNDITYSRARGIPVSSTDARRVFGMDESSYQLLQYPYLVCSAVTNAFAGFGALSKYRLYRRQAQEVRFTSEGKELALKNLTLLVVRGRFGGRVMDANAFSFCDNMQA